VSRKHPDRYVVRSASSVIAFWVGVVVLAVIAGAPLVQGQWRLFGLLLPPALLLAWIFWLVLYRPAIHYDSAKAIVVNIARTHVLPWSHVTRVRQGIGMLFDLDAGKPVQASGAPARRPRGIIASGIDRRTRPTNDINHEAEILEGVRTAAVPSSEPVVSTWNTIPLVIGAVLVIAVIIDVALAA
jgi:hypothetical protein